MHSCKVIRLTRCTFRRSCSLSRKGVIRHQSMAQNDSNTATEGFMRQIIEMLLKEPGPAPAKASAKKPAKKNIVNLADSSVTEAPHVLRLDSAVSPPSFRARVVRVCRAYAHFGAHSFSPLPLSPPLPLILPLLFCTRHNGYLSESDRIGHRVETIRSISDRPSGHSRSDRRENWRNRT